MVRRLSVLVELTKAELQRLIVALQKLIDAETRDGKEPSTADRILLMKLAESF